MIRKDNAVDEDCNGETEIPNDEQINELISRSQEEYDIFMQMDEERYIDEGKDKRL